MHRGLIFAIFTLTLCIAVPAVSTGYPEGHAGIRYPEDSSVINVQTHYGAKGDGMTDDTAALLKAIGDDRGTKQRILYFPRGTYLVSDTLDWKDRNGIWKARLTLQGEDETTTIIRLKDHLQNFQDASAPRPLIRTGSIEPWDKITGTGNNGFRNYLFDLTIDIGKDNPGTVAIDYLGNNVCGLGNVTIRTSDSQMRGVAGLMMKRPYVGPCLYKNLTVKGFDHAIVTDKTEYSHTFVHLTISDQKVAGIFNMGNVLSIRNLNSSNTVPAIRNKGLNGLVTIIDSKLINPDRKGNAIENEGGLFLRNLVVQGYEKSVSMRDGPPFFDNIIEYSTHTVKSLFGGDQPASLGLPIEEAPTHDRSDLRLWLNIVSKGANGTDKKKDSTLAIQAALDADAEVIYLPQGQYMVSDTIHIRGNTKQIVGFGAVIMPSGRKFSDGKTPAPVFSYESKRSDLIIEGVQFGWFFAKHYPAAVWIEHNSPRTLVLKHVDFQGTANCSYRNTKQATGSLFLEDVVGGKWSFNGPQKIWAHQFNVEGFTDNDKVANAGATLWILGLKTEKLGTVIRTVDSGSTELLGALLYPVVEVDVDQPAFIIEGASVSLTYTISAYRIEKSYQSQIIERHGQEALSLRSADVSVRGQGSMVSLYSSRATQ